MTFSANHGDIASPAHDDRSARDRWKLVQDLLQEALVRTSTARRAYLDAHCPEDSLRAEVEALVAAHESRGALDQLMDDVMVPLLSPESQGGSASVHIPTLPRYRIVERLGGGGMGVVYRARDERLDRDVALKFLPPHLSADEAANKRFLVEARAAAALEHPNICTVHEIGATADGQLYIVMACYDGETLERRIARGPLPAREAIHAAAEVARGLSKAHERGIVHRDIKPSNVIVTADGLVKILDFGIAKLTSVGVTHTGGVVGTLAYMSPEQAFGDPVDHRTDIWSLGVVLYEMLTGVRPFRGPGAQSVLFNALADEPEPVSGIRADVPTAVDRVIARALAKRPADRFGSANEFLASLAACEASPTVGSAGAPAIIRNPTAPEDSIDSALTRGGERRQVTVVACRTGGYEEIVERLSPDRSEHVLTRIRNAATDVATQHGGIVNHFFGDGLVMLFGVSTAHEDDTLRAVRAVLALHARVAAIAATLEERVAAALRLRSGIHVGTVVARRLREGDRRFRLTGSTADVANRLAAAAEPDTVLVSSEARRLVDPFVNTEEGHSIPLRADGASITTHRVLGPSAIRSRLEGAVRLGLTPFVGRERERASLIEQLAAGRAGAGGFTWIVGEAGAGKSRLLYELRETAAASGTSVLVGRCDAGGGSVPFLPFVEAAQQVLALPPAGTAHERHDALVAAARAIDPSFEEFIPLYLALLAIPSETHPVPAHLRGELFQTAMLEALAALFTISARTVPTLLLLEDWHWADEASRAALRQLVEIVVGFPLLVVVTSRPYGTTEWAPADHQTLIHLSPLDVTASSEIARAVLGADRLPRELATRLHERTGGNPFFLEELCAALREQGAVTVHGGEAAVTDTSGSMHVPDTVQGVLRTRIDRLDGEARDVLRVAAVIGREFTRGILEDVLEHESDPSRALERLKGSGLVQQVSVVPEPAYRFKHALTQEVAYDSLLEHQRRALHAAVGRSIEHRYATHLDEHADRLAQHFGRAEAWPEAVHYGLRAADRATALSQNADALSTLERVEEWVLRLPDDVARRDLHADVLLRQERLCEALGLRSRQLVLVESLIALLAPHGPSERLAQAYLRQGDAFTLLRRFESAERSLETAQRIAQDRADDAGARNALRSLALLRSYEGRHEEALANIERVLELSRAAGDTRAEAGDLATMANVLRALGQNERALAVLETALARTVAADNPVRYGALLNVIGTIYRDLGDYDTALDYFQRVSLQVLEPRHPVNASFTLPAIAHIQLKQGRIDEALATYHRAVEINRRARYADGAAHACRSLGEVLVGLGRDEEASPYLREAAALFQQLEDRVNEALMRRRLALIDEKLGRHADALAAWNTVRALQNAAGNVAGEAEAVEGLARTARHLSVAPEQVVARYEEALALATRLGDRHRELAVRNALGIVHWQRGAYSDAVRHYEAALRLCRESGDRVHEGLILNSLGSTLHRLRRWDEARTALHEAVRVAEETGERRLRAHALALLGEVSLVAGRLGEAEAHVRASLALRRELEDRRGEGWMLERLARIKLAANEIDAARSAGDESSAIANELDDEQLQAAVARLPLGSPTPEFPQPR